MASTYDQILFKTLCKYLERAQDILMNNWHFTCDHYTEGITCGNVDQIIKFKAKESTKFLSGQLLNIAEAACVGFGEEMDLGSGYS